MARLCRIGYPRFVLYNQSGLDRSANSLRCDNPFKLSARRTFAPKRRIQANILRTPDIMTSKTPIASTLLRWTCQKVGMIRSC